jgi:hypothetical protein
VAMQVNIRGSQRADYPNVAVKRILPQFAFFYY